MSRYGVSESTSSGGQLAGQVGDELVPRRERRRARPTAPRARASSRISSIGTGLPRRDDSRCVITTFASLASQPLRDGRRGEAGEDRHLDRADVRACVRGDRRPRATSAGRSRRGRRARRRARRAPRRAASPRARARRSVSARREPSSPRPDRREHVGRALGPAVHAVARDRDLARRRTRSSTPARASRRTPASTARRTRAPCPRSTSGQNHSGLLGRARDELGELADARAPRRAASRSRARRRLVGAPDDLAHAPDPTGVDPGCQREPVSAH